MELTNPETLPPPLPRALSRESLSRGARRVSPRPEVRAHHPVLGAVPVRTPRSPPATAPPDARGGRSADRARRVGRGLESGRAAPRLPARLATADPPVRSRPRTVPHSASYPALPTTLLDLSLAGLPRGLQSSPSAPRFAPGGYCSPSLLPIRRSRPLTGGAQVSGPHATSPRSPRQPGIVLMARPMTKGGSVVGRDILTSWATRYLNQPQPTWTTTSADAWP
jgi:hypothetical protein